MRNVRALAWLAAAAVLLLGACADDDQTGTATTTTESDGRERTVDQAVVDRVSEAAGNTVDEGTARFELTVETTDVAVEAEDDAATTTTAGRGTTTTDDRDGTAAASDQRFEAEGEVDFEADQRQLTIEGPEGTTDVVVDGDDVYIELPATEDEDWMRVELDRLFDRDVGFGGPAALPFQDPESNLRVLQGSVVHAQQVGEDEIDGEETTHYELIIDLDEAGDQAADDVQAALQETTARTGLTELEVEVWVDGDDLIRQVRYTIDLDQASAEDDLGAEADASGDVVATWLYSDFGATVDIDVPADRDVIDLDEDELRRWFSSMTGATGTGGTSGAGSGTGGTGGTSGRDTTTTTSGSRNTTSTTSTTTTSR